MTGGGKSRRNNNRNDGPAKVEDDEIPDKENEEDENKEESNSEDEEDDYEFKWLDKGKRRRGRIEYDSVLLTLHETSFRVSKSDFVLLWGIHGDETEADKEPDGDQTIEEIWQSAGCAKVEAMWEEPADEDDGRTKAMFQARWFFQVIYCLFHWLVWEKLGENGVHELKNPSWFLFHHFSGKRNTIWIASLARMT
jgi:hypothetical protein